MEQLRVWVVDYFGVLYESEKLPIHLNLAFLLHTSGFTFQSFIKPASRKVKKKLDNQDKNIELVRNYLDKLLKKKESPRKTIAYKVFTRSNSH